MDEQTLTSDVSGEPGEADEDVLEQADTKHFAFMAHIDTEPGEQGNRLGVAASTFAERSGAASDWTWAMHQA